MANSRHTYSDQPARYHIQIVGEIRPSWSDWLSGMEISASQDSAARPATNLIGTLPDQAALRGVLCRLWDLNLIVLSVTRINAEQKESEEDEQESSFLR